MSVDKTWQNHMMRHIEYFICLKAAIAFFQIDKINDFTAINDHRLIRFVPYAIALHSVKVRRLYNHVYFLHIILLILSPQVKLPILS